MKYDEEPIHVNLDNIHPNPRDQVIAGLRALATFLEANPGVPVNDWAHINYNADGESDQEQRDEIDRVAAIVGYPPHTEADGGHYLVEAEFGPVKYRAVAITAARMAAYCAAATYHGAVTP